MIERPTFKPHFHVELLPGQGVFVLSERGNYRLTGPVYEMMAPLLDGKLTNDQIAATLAPRVAMAEVYYALTQLETLGYLTEADPDSPPWEAAFWSSIDAQSRDARNRLRASGARVLELLPGTAAMMTGALQRQGIPVHEGGGLTVIVSHEYLTPELERFNAEALRDGRPWMLVKPIGGLVWIGPIFVPGRTGCWQCLAQRLRGQRQVEGLLEELGHRGPFPTSKASVPGSVEQAIAAAAVQVAIWLGTGANAALEGRILVHDVAAMTTTPHVVARRPQCATCGDGELLQRRDLRIDLEPSIKSSVHDGGHRSLNPDVMLDRYGHHVSPVCGVVSGLEKVDRDAESPLNVYYADHNFALGGFGYLLDSGPRSASAGKGKSDVQARASALGEGIERYSGVFQGDERRTRGSLLSLSEAAIHPNECMLFSERQYAEREEINALRSRYYNVPKPLDASTELDWSPVWSMGEERIRYLPTRLLYYAQGVAPWSFYCSGDSNGCAAGTSLEEAILQGFLEVIERDAVALWWYNRVQRPGVDLASFDDPYFERLARFYRSLDRDLWVLDLTSDFGIPVFAALSRRTDHPVEDIIFGFGAHLDPAIGVARALTEMNQVLPGARGRDAKGNAIYTYQDSATLDWWTTATIDSQPYVLPLEEQTKGADDYPDLLSDDIADEVRFCIDLAAQKGYDTLVLDQTRPDIGLPVVKVIVPGVRHFWPRFAPGRLYDVPVELGWLKTQTPESELNPIAMFL